MGESSHGSKKGSTPRPSMDGYDDLQEQMADAAGDAARNAADSIAQAVGAITVALGLKAAKPIAETAEDLGIVLGEVLSNFARKRNGDWEDLEIVVIGRDEEEV